MIVAVRTLSALEVFLTQQTLLVLVKPVSLMTPAWSSTYASLYRVRTCLNICWNHVFIFSACSGYSSGSVKMKNIGCGADANCYQWLNSNLSEISCRDLPASTEKLFVFYDGPEQSYIIDCASDSSSTITSQRFQTITSLTLIYQISNYCMQIYWFESNLSNNCLLSDISLNAISIVDSTWFYGASSLLSLWVVECYFPCIHNKKIPWGQFNHIYCTGLVFDTNSTSAAVCIIVMLHAYFANSIWLAIFQ